MPQTESSKKTTGSTERPTKKAPAAKSKTARSSKTTKTSARQPFRLRREIKAGFLFLLAFIGILSDFHVEGFLLRWYRALTGDLLGAGAAVLPLSLIGAGILLLRHRRGKARVRCIAAMLATLFFSSLRHLLLITGPYERGLAGFKQMAADGRLGQSGGWLAGGMAELLKAAISSTGAVILLVTLLVLAIFVAIKLMPGALWRFLQRLRPAPEPDEEDDVPAPMAARAAQRNIPAQSKTSKSVDLSLSGEPRSASRKHGETIVPPPSVPTPAEALRGLSRREKTDEARTAERQEHQKTEVAESIFSALRPQETPAESTPPEQPTRAPAEAHEAAAPAASAEETDAQIGQQIEQAIASSGDGDKPSYLYPSITLLKAGSGRPESMEEQIDSCKLRLVDTLRSFGVESEIVNITSGPTVTRYELQLERGVKFSKVTGLSDDIALALGASGVRVSTIPDNNAVGIEVPNDRQELVTVRDIIGTPAFRSSRSRLSFAVGKNIAGEAVVGDIGKMPHMLIAGTTGSGKSVCINSILISLLYKSTPEEVRLIMVDPKMIELGVYNGIPHLLIPVVTDPRKAAGALNWAVGEMMKRYRLFAEVGVRDLNGYNDEMRRREDGVTLPRVVIVIDELSDLMATARKEVEEAIIRLAQMARAAGMHLIIATQRPSADVITGLMKTNIPSRIAFAVASAIDSRIILDQSGAEKLIGRGDMLYAPLGGGKPQRVQGCFVTDSEVEEVVRFVKMSGQPDYDQEVMEQIEHHAAESEGGAAVTGDETEADDEMLDAAIGVVVEEGRASASTLQRRLRLGYARAARLIDIMEQRGIVGPFEGSKPRQVLITADQWKEMRLRKENL